MITVAILKAALAQIPDDWGLVRNAVGNVAIMQNGEYVGWIEVLTGEVCWLTASAEAQAALAERNLNARGRVDTAIAIHPHEDTTMPNPNSPEIKAQRQQVQQQIEALEQQVENAGDGEDTSAQEQQLDQLHDQLRDLQRQQKDFRSQNRQTGGGRDKQQNQPQ